MLRETAHKIEGREKLAEQELNLDQVLQLLERADGLATASLQHFERAV